MVRLYSLHYRIVEGTPRYGPRFMCVAGCHSKRGERTMNFRLAIVCGVLPIVLCAAMPVTIKNLSVANQIEHGAGRTATVTRLYEVNEKNPSSRGPRTYQ